jgi:hypothetical protein
MPSYIINDQGSYCYIKQSISYWDKEIKKPRSKQRCIGKIDKQTGHIKFYSEFIESTDIETIKIKDQVINIRSQNNYLNLYNKPYRESIIGSSGYKYDTGNDSIDFDNRLIEPLSQNICPIEVNNFKHFGGTYFIKQIAEQTKVLDILREVFPKKWKLILNLAMFILLENKKMSHCEHFINNFYVYPNFCMKS